MHSLTYGEVSLDETYSKIKEFIAGAPEYEYKITVGTDSQNFDMTKTVVVIAVHRIGRGGIFFYDIIKVRKMTNVRQKILYETHKSLEIALALSNMFLEEDLDYDIEIHIDAGKNGKSAAAISEAVGMVQSCGFESKIKPDSYAASSIANMISK